MCLAATADHVADRVGQTRQTMRQARTARKKYNRQSTWCGWPAHFEYSEAGKPGLSTPCCQRHAANAMLPASTWLLRGWRCTTEGTASTGRADTKTEARKRANARAGGDTPQILCCAASACGLPAPTAARTRPTTLPAPTTHLRANNPSPHQQMSPPQKCTVQVVAQQKTPPGQGFSSQEPASLPQRGKITSS